MKQIRVNRVCEQYVDIPDDIAASDTDAVRDWLEANDAWPDYFDCEDETYTFEEAPE